MSAWKPPKAAAVQAGQVEEGRADSVSESIRIDANGVGATGVASMAAGRSWSELFADVSQLIKLKVNVLVLITTFVGFRLAEASAQLGAVGFLPATSWTVLLHALIGTTLLGCGASTLNQYFERLLDSRMERTRLRPLPAGRLSPDFARTLGVLLTVVGVVYLAFLVNPVCAAVGASTSLIYIFVYTPLKRLSTWSLVVGAVPGALPPIIGWTAVSGSIEGAAWALFTIQFLWQIPHFLAIAWIYREDYARAKYRLLTVVDTDGFTTAIQTVAWSAAMLPASLTIPVLFRLGGPLYFFGALALGIIFLASAIYFAVKRTNRSARVLLYVSLVYLPMLFILLAASV